jgi:hypothetical protein
MKFLLKHKQYYEFMSLKVVSKNNGCAAAHIGITRNSRKNMRFIMVKKS